MAFYDRMPNFESPYNKMIAGRERVDHNSSQTCKKCGRYWGDHLIPGTNPHACVFEKKVYPKNPR